jgi:hypothetical protein
MVRLLDVPYVPQSEALCGGAAVAMVLRFWGEPAVVAEDFEALLEPSGSGIRTDSLVAAVRGRGWIAFPFTGNATTVQAQLAAGRPVIALIRERRGAFHYVVLLAWANGGVILHDPAAAPFRTRREREFENAWAGSHHWALLLLPAQATVEPTDPDTSTAAALTGCEAIVDDAIARARAGDPAGAERRLLSAAALCPESASPTRGLAGLRFAAKDWAGASRLAERALALDPDDAYTWRLLAGSRFLMDDEPGALRAWNRVAEPRADLARVDGLARIRYRAVSAQLDFPPGSLLTARAFVRARRRLAEIPAQSQARLRLTPQAHGSALVNAVVLERPLLFAGPLDAGGTGIRALLEREVVLRIASPTGNGELWTAAASWRHERPRASLALAIPAPGGHPGIWHVEGFWERQAYATPAMVRREERRRSALSFSDWIAPGLRLELGGALDRWSARGAHIDLDGQLDARAAGDRLALTVRLAQWVSLERGPPFRTGDLSVRWRTRAFEDGGWSFRAGLVTASPRAPLALWSGAGTGRGREALLRAHPLLDDGVVTGRAFGRTLVSAGIERQSWACTFKTVRVGWMAFIDGAQPHATLQTDPVPWQTDAGVGLRIAAPASRGEIRVTAARGLADGKSAIALGWEVR